MNKIVLSLFVILSIIPLFTNPNLSLSDNTTDLEHSKSNSDLDQVVDVSVVGNVYLSKPEILNGEKVDIYGVVRNDGDFSISSYVVFTIRNHDEDFDIASQKVLLEPDEERYVKTSWIAVEGKNEIIIKAQIFDYIDSNPENNLKSTIVNVLSNSQSNNIEKEIIQNEENNNFSKSSDTNNEGNLFDITISEKESSTSIYELKPGDSRTIDLSIISKKTDEFRIIVGGITDSIYIKPDLWILNLIENQAFNLQITVSASNSVEIGTDHKIELLLYRSSNPSEMIQKYFNIIFVSEYTEFVTTNLNLDSSSNKFKSTFSIASINEINPPTIDNISITPTHPSISQNVTVNADIIDDSIIVNATLFYTIDVGSSWLNASMIQEVQNTWSGEILTPGFEVNVTYYILSFDNFSNSALSSQYNFIFDGTPPTIGEIFIDDNTPNYQQNVTITTQVIDNDKIGNVTLYYSFDGGNNWFTIDMTGNTGFGSSSIIKDVLLVSHTQDTTYLTRNGYTFDSISETSFSSITESTLRQYKILILEPNWSNYNSLRNGLAVVNQTLNNHSLAVAIRVAGNGGSQLDIDFLGTDYDRSITHSAESIIDSNHPFISGVPWSGNPLSASYFNSWSSTDHGWLYNNPSTQEDFFEILQNANGISMFEYTYKGSRVLVDTLTSIDGGWGFGNDIVADNFINYLNYSYYQLEPSFYGVIPSAPADTTVLYYINATDMANNSVISGNFSYFSDGTSPQILNVTQNTIISELDSFIINASITDNWGLDNGTAILIYTYDNITYFQMLMTQITGNDTNAIYQGVSPATSQSKVFYSIEITDLSGLIGISGNYSYLVDQIPILTSQFPIPSHPNVNTSVTINATVSDDYGISSVTLYYNYNSTWDQISMNLNQGVYQASIPATINDTNVDYIISMTDSFGHQVNTSIYSYYSDGTAPSFTSITHIPTQPNGDAPVSIQANIYDLNGVLNATLSYSNNTGITWTNISMSFNAGYWEANIPALNQSIEIYYFVTAFDLAEIGTVSNQTSFVTDIESPQFFNVTEVGIVSELVSVPINVTITDNYGINTGSILLFYSYDNTSWFSTSMSLITGDSSNGIYTANSPSSSQNFVYYYIQAYDLSGRINISLLMNYTIDHQPTVIIDKFIPSNPSIFMNVNVYSNVTDDFGINQVDLYYYFNNTWQLVGMVNSSGQFIATIGATNMDTQVSYYVSVTDSFGHIVNTSTFMYYADGLSPKVENISYLPAFPSYLDNVTVSVDIYDNQDIANATLYYTTNGTWFGINIPSPSTIVTGRNPISGYFYGTTETVDHNSGELGRLSLYVYTADLDTLYVTLWGLRIDTGIWEQFYYSGSIGTMSIPDFTWITPIYEQWRIQIYDSELNDNFYYSYEYSDDAITQIGYGAIIPATNASVTLQFYIEAFDIVGNRGNSSTFSYFTDADNPSISNITIVSTVSELTGVTINATVSDNVAVDTNLVVLFYSYDQSTWYNGLMSLSSGTNSSGIYSGFIPATNESIVYYFVNATDISGLTNQTSIFNYDVDRIPYINEITVNPLYPNPSTLTSVTANITDDNSLNSVSLFYEFIGSSGLINMTESGGFYEAVIPATVVDSIVNFTIIIIDSFGHNISNSGFSYYSDGITPVIQKIKTIPSFPNYLQNVTVLTEIDDNNEMRDVTLYYSFDLGNSWTPVMMNKSLGGSDSNPVADVLLVSHSQDTTYLTRNGFTFNTISELQFSTITISTLQQYKILILEPNWSNYAYLRNGLITVDQALNNHSLVVSIRVGGNGGSQADIDLLGTDYTQAYINAETILDSNHPFISGQPWGGNTLLTSNFNSWGYTDHGYLSSLPTTQSGYTEILQNVNGISMFEYGYKDSHIIVDTLTSIDGSWGSGNDPVADNYINYLEFAYSTLTPGYAGIIPVAPADTTVQYFIEATDMANNTQISGIFFYFVDGGAPTIGNISQFTTVSELNSVTIQTTVSDGLAVDNSSVLLVYTYDNLTYYQTVMSFISGDNKFGLYQGISPATSQQRVYYYIYAEDISGLSVYSGNFSYQVDRVPIIQNILVTPANLSSSDEIFFLADVNDDIGIANATLYYNFNSSWTSIIMSQQGSDFQTTIPALNVDANLNYYIVIFDTFGHQVSSTQDVVYVDGLNPSISNLVRTPEYPINNTPVIVSSAIDDFNAILNSTLFYSVNGSNWIAVNMNQTSTLTINGRNPISGYFASGTTQTVDHNTGGAIQRLLIYVYSSDADTIVVTLWGFTIDTGSWVNFYSASNLVSGYLPEFNWATPVYEQFRIQIYDSEGNDQFYYSYEYDVESNFEAQIPGFNQDTNITYFIQAFDASGNHAESANYSYVIDGTSPVVTNITQLSIESAIDPVTIGAKMFDKGGINESNVLLYYSFDNSSWFNTQMIRETGTFQNGSYSGTIPASITSTTVYYYIYVEDLSGFNFTSSIYTFLTLDVSITLQSPGEFSTLNGTEMVNFGFLVNPNTSIVEISYDQGNSWTNITNVTGNLFSFELNTLTVPEGLLEVWLNVSVIPGLNLIRTYTFYVDRSIPQIINVTNATLISGAGQTLYVTIQDAIITANMTKLYYTFDNLTWYMTQMILENQTSNEGTFSGIIPPAAGDLSVSYYVYVVDELGWTNQSSTFTSLIDYEPIINSVNQSSFYVHSDIPVSIYTQIIDDFGIYNVTLNYNINNTDYSVIMNFQNGIYVGTIPATVSDGNVSYSITVFDTFLQQVESANYYYYSDGINPNITSIIESPANPNKLTPVNVYINVKDTNPLRNATLYYTFDSTTWFNISFIVSGIQTFSGRNPLSGTYLGETITTNYNSGPLSRLHIYSYSSDGDTIAVTLSGFRIDTGVWEQFYTSTTLTTGYIPEFSWVNIIYDQWRIEINDTEFDDNFYYSYEYDIEMGYSAQIPSSNFDGYVEYYVDATDMANRTSTTGIRSYYTDGIFPTISGVSIFAPVSEFVSPRVYATISDNNQFFTPILFYSADQITWYSQAMTLESGNLSNGRFYYNIPAISNGLVAYYIEVTDTFGLLSTSITRYYSIDTRPEISLAWHYPTEISLNTAITINAFVVDDYGVAEVNLYYWVNGIITYQVMTYGSGVYQAIINPIGLNANVDYVINAVDTIGQSTNSSINSFVVDGLVPSITFIQAPTGNLTQASEVAIEVLVEDNGQLNMNGTSLYYSLGNNSWTQISMQHSGDTTTGSKFIGILPNYQTNVFYYYVTSFDKVGLMNTTRIMKYYIENFLDTDNDGVADWTEINVFGSNQFSNDTDGDSLLDFDEVFFYYTNVNNPDTEQDGMPDGWEVFNSLNPLINDAPLDGDMDELTNLGEYQIGSNPNNPDSDSDGMPDGWEVFNSLNPLINDSQSDPDNDDLKNIDEFNADTDPQNQDSDGDGMPDGWEILNLLNPLINDGREDPDNDTLSNIKEFTNDLNPHNSDTDGDNMPDGWEVANNLNPLENDADLDADDDGFTNIQEYELDSDPNDASDPGNSNSGIVLIVVILTASSIPISYISYKNRSRIAEFIKKYTKK